MRVFILSSLFLAGGCVDAGTNDKVDTDGDGLTDTREASLGTDPTKADTDGDTLSDGDEVNGGTDPTLADTDGDTYLDSWELAEGTDPLDPESRIYTGYWPYNPDKDSIEEPGSREHAKVGHTVPRFAFADQYGQPVDIYDFAGHGKPVVLDLSGEWCYWCNEVAKLMEGKRNDLRGYGWDDMPDLLAAGDFYWVTVLDADWQEDTIDQDELGDWWAEYPNPDILIEADTEQQVTAWVAPVGYPSIMLLDENLEITTYDAAGDYTKVFDEIEAEFGTGS